MDKLLYQVRDSPPVMSDVYINNEVCKEDLFNIACSEFSKASDSLSPCFVNKLTTHSGKERVVTWMNLLKTREDRQEGTVSLQGACQGNSTRIRTV